MNFGYIVGQNHIKSALANAVKKDEVGHAYAFCGPKGIGKKSLARVFAGALICSNSSVDGGCGQCLSCRMFNGGYNPDFREIQSEGKSIGIDEIRSIQSDIIVKPVYSRRKVYLIDDAENMTLQAQNCFLKTLEEPPSYAVILLTASNYEALIDTIKSRVIKYNFKKNSYKEIYEILQSKLGKKSKEIEFLASFADGVVGKALELAKSPEFIELRNKTVEMVFEIPKQKMLRAFELYEFFKQNKQDVDIILDIMATLYRDLLVVNESGQENMLINSDKKDIIISNANGFSIDRIIRSIETVELTRNNIKKNVNYQLSIEVMLLKLQEELG